MRAAGLTAFLDTMTKRLYGRTLGEAHAAHICVRCGTPVDYREWDVSDQNEYLLSGYCPGCYRAITPKDCE